MISNIKECENYEFIVFKKHLFKNQLKKALDIVKNYIIDNNLIITGGMAIDLALKNKGSGIYSDLIMPDYDFYSSDFHNDAYKIGHILCNMDMGDVDIINAAHSTTMRVRINFEPVADVTYIPKKLFDKIPTIKHKDGRIFEHPHYKMINIHRALSYPYENSPYEVILHRFNKDMKRYDQLYEFYPMLSASKITMHTVQIPVKILENECLSGFIALHYWILKNQNETVKVKNSNDAIFVIPNTSTSKCISLLSDDPISLKDKILKQYDNISSDKISISYYNQLLDNIPSKIIITIKDEIIYEILDNRGRLTSAHKILFDGRTNTQSNEFYAANLQFLMQQFLVNYFLLADTKSLKNINMWCYRKSFDMVKKASDAILSSSNNIEKFKNFLPTSDVMGKYNISKSDVNRQTGYLAHIGEIKMIRTRARPFNIYPKLENKCKIDNKIKYFELEKSWIFSIDGSKRGDMPIGINERTIN